jgi:hypothetical protein
LGLVGNGRLSLFTKADIQHARRSLQEDDSYRRCFRRKLHVAIDVRDGGAVTATIISIASMPTRQLRNLFKPLTAPIRMPRAETTAMSEAMSRSRRSLAGALSVTGLTKCIEAVDRLKRRHQRQTRAHAQSAVPGEPNVVACTSTARLIEREKRSISGSALDVTSLQPKTFSQRQSRVKGLLRKRSRWMATRHLIARCAK